MSYCQQHFITFNGKQIFKQKSSKLIVANLENKLITIFMHAGSGKEHLLFT